MMLDEYFSTSYDLIYGSGEFTPSTKGKGKCSVCGNETVWMEVDFNCYICSTECYDRLLDETIESLK